MRSYILFCIISLICTTARAYKKNRINITCDGKQRNMLVFTPDELPDNSPLFIITHGMGGNSDEQSERDRMYELIDTAKFVVAYPKSDGDYWDISGTKDQNFIIKTIDEMVKRHKINKKRVYWSGFSMGSMLIFHCMPNMLDRIAAFAPTSGIQFSEEPWTKCKKKVNVIECIAYGDNAFYYDKYNIRGYMENMAKMNKYTKYTKKSGHRSKNGMAAFDGDRELWLNEETGHEVVLFSFNYGKSTHTPVAENSYEIWNFCKRFQLGSPMIVPPDLKLIKATPEDNSFDLPLTTKEFQYEFDKKIDCERIVATLTGKDGNITLLKVETGLNATITFILPDGTELQEGEYTLTISEINDERNIKATDISYHYYFGYTEVGTDTEGNSPAIVYKKAFLQAMENAKNTFYQTEGESYSTAEALRSDVKSMIDTYESLTSTSPTVYKEATNKLNEVTKTLQTRKTNLDNYFMARERVEKIINQYKDDEAISQSTLFQRLLSHYEYYDLPEKYMVRDAKLITATENLNEIADKFLNDLATGIQFVSQDNSTVRSTCFFDLSGRAVEKPEKGIFIMKTTFGNGKTETKKIIIN